MNRFGKIVQLLFIGFLSLLAFANCKQNSKDDLHASYQKGYEAGQRDCQLLKKDQSDNQQNNLQNNRKDNHNNDRNRQNRNSNQIQNSVTNNGTIPDYVVATLRYIKEHSVAPENYVGGRKFGNYENYLPEKTNNKQSINYQEWDVHPKVRGQNRGAERLVTGSDGRSWFTKDHYKSFIEIKE
jgi:ribonuclease T1